MTEAIAVFVTATALCLAFGAYLHRQEARIAAREEALRNAIPPERVRVWKDGALIYDGPERRSSDRHGTDGAPVYRWPDLVEEATTEPTGEDEIEEARRLAAKHDPWGEHTISPGREVEDE